MKISMSYSQYLYYKFFTNFILNDIYLNLYFVRLINKQNNFNIVIVYETYKKRIL